LRSCDTTLLAISECAGGYERLVRVAVEELDLYAVVAAQLRRAQTMHPVDDSHGLPVHDNRRLLDARLSQYSYVINALAVEAGSPDVLVKVLTQTAADCPSPSRT
jgi:hypothetical protein